MNSILGDPTVRCGRRQLVYVSLGYSGSARPGTGRVRILVVVVGSSSSPSTEPVLRLLRVGRTTISTVITTAADAADPSRLRKPEIASESFCRTCSYSSVFFRCIPVLLLLLF